MPDVEVRGADQLTRLARTLRQVGDKDLKKELRRGINEAVQPVKASIRARALSSMPRRGGLNQVMARSRITVSQRGSGANPGVRLVTKSHNPRIDKGIVRHPVRATGPREDWTWVDQPVKPGWFTHPAAASAPITRLKLLAAMRRIERQLEGRP